MQGVFVIKMIKGMSIIFSCLFLGEIITIFLPLPLPANITGMLLLFIFLVTGAVNLESVEEAGDLLLDHLVLFFIPVGVGIIRFLDLLRAEIISVMVVGIGGFFLLFLIMAWLIEQIVKRRSTNVTGSDK